jgi:D-3-phosphoglycerate dehydrogenase / 2-oxoglutarate reductase
MKLLIIDHLHDSIHSMLAKLDIEFDYHPEWNRTDILNHISHYEGIIIRSKMALDEEFFSKATNLRLIARAGSGLDQIDVDIAKSRQIAIFNAPEGNRDAVAEHTMGLLLALLHKINLSHQQIQNNTWSREPNRGIELKGKTVAIIGYGNVGQEFAKRLSGFDCKILAYDTGKFEYSNAHVQESDMEAIFENADIVSFHIPLTSLTQRMVNTAYIYRFKKNILILNTARGEIVELEALCEAIQSGKVWGAGLDVLENEKINQLSPTQSRVFQYLKTSEKVILTPHVAGWTHESYYRINEVLVAKIRNFLKEKL